MMQQYEEAKQACRDALLLFRMGDFYEMFHDDAKTAARVLNLALTSRDKGENADPDGRLSAPSAGKLPGQADRRRLAGGRLRAGRRPEEGQGLVRREVTRIVTPGTVTDDALLDPRESNYLAAVAGAGQDRGPGRAGLGRAFHRPVRGGRSSRPRSWPINWPASPRPNAW